MKLHSSRNYAVLAVAGAVLAASGLFELKAADKKTPALDPKLEEMMKKCEEAGRPGAAHKTLDALVGNWKAEIKCWMPGAEEPMESKGSSKSTWVLAGRFVQEEFNGEFMGKPFHGISFIGYDNTKQKYTSVWLDDMSTMLFTSEGAVDGAGKVFTLLGKMDDPMTGQKNKEVKSVVRIISPDKHVFEMHDLSLGDKSKTMEITYTRK